MGRLELAAGVQDMLAADNVDAMIQVRVFQRRPYAGPRRQMHHHLRPGFLEQVAQARLVADILFVQLKQIRVL